MTKFCFVHIEKAGGSNLHNWFKYHNLRKQIIKIYKGYNHFVTEPIAKYFVKKMKKKILVVATSSNTRGGITSVVNAYKSTAFWETWNCVWVETHIDKSMILKLLFLIKAFFKFLIMLPTTALVHVHLSGPISVKRKLIFIKLSKLFNKKLIIHFHAFSADATIDHNFKGLYLKVFKSADNIVVLSNSWKQGLIDTLGLKASTIKVIYNPCPIIDLNKNIAKQPTILYAGTLNTRKNYKALIKAFARIAHKYPEWKVVLAGNGEIQQAQDLAKKLNVEKNVECVGWINGLKKSELFSKASIFCLPSYAEGFPMAVLDAWAYGLPVVTTPVGGIPDIAKDGDNIILFEPDDIDALAQKIEQLVVDEYLRNKMIEAAFRFSKSTFNIDEIILNMDEIYQNLIG